MFASSIATYLALGYNLLDAIDKTEEFIDKAINYGSKFSFGSGLGPIYPFYKN